MDFFFDEQTILIRKAKGGKRRYVPILPELAQELRTHLRDRNQGYLFETNRHAAFSPRRIQQLVKETADLAGLTKRVTPHTLRHYLPFLTMSGNVGKHRCKRGSGDAFTRDNLELFRKTKNRHRIEMTRSVGPESRESRLHLLSLLSGRRADAE